MSGVYVRDLITPQVNEGRWDDANRRRVSERSEDLGIVAKGGEAFANKKVKRKKRQSNSYFERRSKLVL